jgi:hypothetical protein
MNEKRGKSPLLSVLFRSTNVFMCVSRFGFVAMSLKYRERIVLLTVEAVAFGRIPLPEEAVARHRLVVQCPANPGSL